MLIINLYTVEENDAERYFTRVDIDMSPDRSSSNGSRSPNAISQGRTLSPIKDINQQYSSLKQNQDILTKQVLSPIQKIAKNRKLTGNVVWTIINYIYLSLC